MKSIGNYMGTTKTIVEPLEDHRESFGKPMENQRKTKRKL